MFNIQHYPSDLVSRVETRLCDVFSEYFDDTYNAQTLPGTGHVKHMGLVVNREDAAALTARDFMDLHYYLTAVCYDDPLLKDLITFDDFYFKPGKEIHVVTLGFDLF